jgi:predicted DNA-binding protein (UPF0251 family)
MTNQYIATNWKCITTAKNAHDALRAQTVSAVRLGDFYRDVLASGLWTSQAAMSRDMGVSTSKISRALTAARLPKEVVTAFDHGEAVTYRRAHAINSLILALGKDAIRRKATLLPKLRTLTVEQFVLAVVKEPFMGSNDRGISLVVDEPSRSIRIETACFEQLRVHLRELERFVRLAADVLVAADGEPAVELTCAQASRAARER